jgi:chromosome segregation ATPase
MRAAALLAVVTLGGAAVALAQPRAFIRVKEQNERQSSPNMCMSRRNIIASEERRYDSNQSELARVEAELNATQRRLDDLRRQRDELRRDVSSAERRLRIANDGYKRDCSDTENCDAYDQRADDLDRQTQATQVQLDNVRNDIKQNRDEAARLQVKIEPLAKEYNEKKCNALVPGETPDSVAQRCLEIFMDWNKAQGDINRANGRLPDLRSRYEQLNNELSTIERRAQGYETYMAKNCSSSTRLTKVHEYGTVRQRASTLGQELDALVTDITKLKGVKITVTAQ